MQAVKITKENIYINIVVAIVIFFIFFWTYSFFNTKMEQTKSRYYDLVNQIKKVQFLVQELNNNKIYNYTLNIGLLSFIQQLSTKNNIENHIVNLKTINSNNNTEIVYVKFNSLTLNQLLKIIKDIELYNNLYIQKFNIIKHQNNLVNLDIVISKT